MVAAMPGHRRGGVRLVRRRLPLLGPILWMLSVQYFLAQIVVGWVWHPRYSVARNTISDLGNTACGLYGGSYVCSPRHGVMNASFMALGCGMAGGSWLISRQFSERAVQECAGQERRVRERVAASIGFSCLALAGLGTFFVGQFPENTDRVVHLIGAGMGIGVGNVGILVLGLLPRLPPRLARHHGVARRCLHRGAAFVRLAYRSGARPRRHGARRGVSRDLVAHRIRCLSLLETSLDAANRA